MIFWVSSCVDLRVSAQNASQSLFVAGEPAFQRVVDDHIVDRYAARNLVQASCRELCHTQRMIGISPLGVHEG